MSDIPQPARYKYGTARLAVVSHGGSRPGGCQGDSEAQAHRRPRGAGHERGNFSQAACAAGALGAPIR